MTPAEGRRVPARHKMGAQAMNDQDAYATGLRKLKLTEECTDCFDHTTKPIRHSPDLRQDSAFAWRVLEAWRTSQTPDMDYHWIRYSTGKQHCYHTLADALYAAVCQLGKEEL